ncbi:MAG: hypothetical protein JXR91_00470 [Deltaproteobacteria bacterium]|nr:hypothetical protein [Deltaproteobacteria bacterium]
MFKKSSGKLVLNKSDWVDYLIIPFIFLLLLIPFSILKNAYIWDDLSFINNKVFSDNKSFFEVITNLFWQNSSHKDYSEFQPLFRPVTSLLLWIEGKLFNNWLPGFHLVSVLLGFLIGFLVANISSVLMKIKSPGFYFFIISLVVLHPLNAEIISLAVNISDYLALIFLLISLKLNLEYLQNKRGRVSLIIYSLMLFFATASKEFAVLGLLIPLLSISILKAVNIESSYTLLKDKFLLIASLFPVLLFLILRWLVIADGSFDKIDFSIFFNSIIFLLPLLLFRIFAPVPSGAHIYIGSSNYMWIAAFVIISFLMIFTAWRAYKNRVSLPLWAILSIAAVIIVLPSFLAAAKIGDQIVIPVRYFFAGLPFVIIGLIPILNRFWQVTFYKILMVIAIALFSMLFFIRAGEWESSLKFSRAEAVYHPDAFYENDNYIKMLINMEHYDEAMHEVEKMQTSSLFNNNKVKAQVYFYKARILGDHFKNMNTALVEIERAIELNPSNLQYIYEYAFLLLKSNDEYKALQILNDALSSNYFNNSQKDEIKKKIKFIKR